jgi:hypothetical protein
MRDVLRESVNVKVWYNNLVEEIVICLLIFASPPDNSDTFPPESRR